MYLEIEELKKYNIVGLYTYKGTSLEDFHLDKYITYDKQIHSNKVLSTKETNSFINGDGIITDEINLPIITRSKDCVCIFLYDKENRVIGNLQGKVTDQYNAQNSIIDSWFNKDTEYLTAYEMLQITNAKDNNDSINTLKLKKQAIDSMKSDK